MKIPILPILAAGSVVFFTFHLVNSQTPYKQEKPPIAPPQSPYVKTLAGAGIVEPRSENIEVSPVVPGVVEELLVQEGERVTAGQLLFRLDARQPRAQLAVAKASLQQAEENLKRLQALPRQEEVPPSEARVAEAEAQQRRALDTYKRQQKLFDQGAGTSEGLNQALETWKASEASLTRAKSDDELLKAGAWKPEVEIRRAEVELARAEVSRLQTEVERYEVRAPTWSDMQPGTEWEVLQINTRPGEYVSTPSVDAPIILGDTSARRIRVDLDEHDIPYFDPNAPAQAFPRGAGNRSYDLRFVKVEPFVIPKRSLTGDNSERVDTRVLQVLYELENADAPVYVGQQMDVFIKLAQD